MAQLTSEQKVTLKKYVESYNDWLKTKEGQDNLKEHRDHNAFFKTSLSKENIDKISEDKFREIYNKLWASNIWSKKDWYIDNKLLKPNGLQKIKDELKKLLYDSESIDVKFDRFHKEVSGFGPSSISEVLHFVFPDKYCLWNDKPKTVLPFLKINILPDRFFKYNLQGGSDYLQCISVLSLIKEELSNLGFKNPDFIDVDCVLWHIFNSIERKRETKKEKQEEAKPVKVKVTKEITTHEQAEYYLLKLGELLGYLTYTVDSSRTFNGIKLGDCATLKDLPDFAGQRDKNSAREIDVLWFDEDQNPKYCLEVEHTTDITKGLNRLLQLKQFRVIFVIVASEDKRQKFETEMSKSPYRQLRDMYKFISYDELIELYDAVEKSRNLKEKLL